MLASLSPEFLKGLDDVPVGKGREIWILHGTCCIPSLAALTCRVHVPWMSFSFPKTKTAMEITKGESPSQMMSTAEDGFLQKAGRRLIVGGRRRQGAFYIQRGSAAARPFICCSGVITARTEEAGARGTIRAQPWHCPDFSYFILIPLGQMRMKLNTQILLNCKLRIHKT